MNESDQERPEGRLASMIDAAGLHRDPWLEGLVSRFVLWCSAPDIRVVALLVLAGGAGLAVLGLKDSSIWEVLTNLGTELVGIALTVLLVDQLYQKRDRRRQEDANRAALTKALGSRVNSVAIRAVEELRELGSLKDGSLTGVDLGNADLHTARLSHAELREVNLEDSNLEGAELQNANLNGARLSHAKMRQIEASEGSFVGADLTGARLDGADLHGADFSDAELDEAQLAGAHLIAAKLCGASLRRCDLRDAFLSGSDFSGADLEGAQLKSTQLPGVTLTVEQVNQAIMD